MIRETIGFLMLSLVAVIALVIWLSVRRRRAAQEKLIAAPLAATTRGDLETFYVSTVFEAAPLDRIWAHGFAMRGRATLSVGSDGVSVHRTGERSFLIPARTITGIDAATATIDKGVERGGLSMIHWSLGDTKVASHFRFTNPDVRKEFENKVSQLIGAQVG
jgi:hypothetical protein